MPVYVYKNLQTGETFELQQSFKDTALTVHPETGAPVKRVVQPVGIAFKGSGFYVTDSRQQANTTKAAANPDANPGAKANPDAKATTDTKAATKAESTPGAATPQDAAKTPTKPDPQSSKPSKAASSSV